MGFGLQLAKGELGLEAGLEIVLGKVGVELGLWRTGVWAGIRTERVSAGESWGWGFNYSCEDLGLGFKLGIGGVGVEVRKSWG